jgi:nucleoside-diphosphate kinase
VERTLIIIKPDAVQRALIGEIVRRFELRGLRIAHKGKPFYEGLLDYITAAPVVVMALEGTDAIEIARSTIGATKPIDSSPGSIRGDFGVEVGRNLVHGSDKPASAERELNLFFSPDELIDWSRDLDRWVFEG